MRLFLMTFSFVLFSYLNQFLTFFGLLIQDLMQSRRTMSSQSTASNAEKVVRQRGPSRGVTGRDFMVLEFDDFGKAKG